MPISLRSTPPYWSLAARGGGDVAGRTGGATEPLAAGSSSVLDPGTTRADAVVVGAGVAGLLVAEALAATGRDVVVVEARTVASGVSASSTAKVSALHGQTYHLIEDRHGEETARAYGQANLAGVEHVGRVIADHAIDCGWERLPAFTYTTDPATVDEVEAEVVAAAKAGLPVSATVDTGLPYEVAAAVRCEDQAHVDPRRLLVGLAGALRAGGTRIVEGCRILALETGPPHVLHAAGGRIEAPIVVVATLLPFYDPSLAFARSEPVRSYALAATLADPVPAGLYLGVDGSGRSIRPVRAGSTVGIFGGEGHRVGEEADTPARHAALEAWVREQFDVVSVDARWSAQDHVTADHVPFIGAMPHSAPGIHVATGFKKWGFSHAGVAADLIAAVIEDEERPWTSVFDPSRLPAQPGTLRALLEDNVGVAGHFVGDRLRAAAAPDVDELDELAPGEGRVTTVGGRALAVCCGDDGQRLAVEASCSHLGCLVQWNGAERSWDCPCHGSRFEVDGAVITGPAVRPLRRVELEAEADGGAVGA